VLLQPPPACLDEDRRRRKIATLRNIQKYITDANGNFGNRCPVETRKMIERSNHQAKQRYPFTESNTHHLIMDEQLESRRQQRQESIASVVRQPDLASRQALAHQPYPAWRFKCPCRSVCRIKSSLLS
jgi:hypothetical protein